MRGLILLLLFGSLLKGQSFTLMRQDEDWSQTAESLKNIPLGRDGNVSLSLGGDIRERWEWFRNDAWGEEPNNAKGSLLQRYMFHGDLRVGDRFRFFGQLKSGLESGRKEGPRPVDEDRLEVHQAWAEWDVTPRVALRAGRQEVSLGSSRLVSVREGPNVRLSFDGVRLTVNSGAWKVDILALRPHKTLPGIFDDAPDSQQSLWGAYATRTKGPGGWDVYYLGLDRASRTFNQQRGRESRQSFGTRYFSRRENWDFDCEAVWQTGRFAGGAINAWTTASNIGHTWSTVPLKPRLGLKADAASGDANPNDKTLGTFNALFPKGAYFSQADLLGPYNVMDLHPGLSLALTPRLAVSADLDAFWRQSTRDGLYDVPGFPIVPGNQSNARFIGYGTNVSMDWALNRYLSIEAEYQRFLPGRFLRESGRNKVVTYIGVWAYFRF